MELNEVIEKILEALDITKDQAKEIFTDGLNMALDQIDAVKIFNGVLEKHPELDKGTLEEMGITEDVFTEIDGEHLCVEDLEGFWPMLKQIIGGTMLEMAEEVSDDDSEEDED